MAMIPSGVKSPLRQWNVNAFTQNWVRKGNKITIEKPKTLGFKRLRIK